MRFSCRYGHAIDYRNTHDVHPLTHHKGLRKVSNGLSPNMRHAIGNPCTNYISTTECSVSHEYNTIRLAAFKFPAQRPVTRSFDVFFDLHPINGWINNGGAGDLKRCRAHYDVTVVIYWKSPPLKGWICRFQCVCIRTSPDLNELMGLVHQNQPVSFEKEIDIKLKKQNT